MESEIVAYLEQRKAEGQSPPTLKTKSQHLRLLAVFLKSKGKHRFADVKPVNIDAFMRSLADAGNKPSTRMARAWTIRAFFRWLVENGKLLSNPARDIAMPMDEDDLPLPCAPLSEAEVGEIIESVPRRNVIDLRTRLHLELLYGCGLRLAESVALDLKDADVNSRTVRVRAGKGNKGRLLPMMGGVYNALRDYLALRRSLLRGPDHGALLVNNRGKRVEPSSMRDWMEKWNERRKAGKPRIYPHLLRHSIAVHLLRGGADIRHVQEFLGYAQLDTTKIYLRLVPGRLKEDYDRAMPEIEMRG